MRIALYNGTTLYPLAGEAGVDERVHSSAGDFELAPASEVQVAAYVRATHARAFSRGNLLNVISFSSTRRFASPAEAQLWALDYDTAFPAAGTLYLDAVAAGGGTTRRTMAGTVVDPPRRTLLGATVRLDYTVRGGAILNAVPAGALLDADDSVLTDADDSVLTDP